MVTWLPDPEPWWLWLVAAALAPVVVWVLWRLQAVAVDGVLRRSLLKLVRHQSWLYKTVSFFGTLIHELSHASVLLLSGHGIKAFKVGAESGHVTPRRMRQGPVGFLSFLAAAMAPIYIPPAAVLLVAWWVLDRSLLGVPEAGPGLGTALEALQAAVLAFPLRLARILGSLDLAHWGGITVFLLAVLGMPASRPSHVKGSRFHGTKDEGDIAVVRSRLRRNPWPFVAFLVLLYVLYFLLVPWAPRLYWGLFHTVWAVALTGILLALAGGLAWRLVALSGRLVPLVQPVPWLLALAAQVVPRLAPVPFLEATWAMNLASALLFALATVALWGVARRRV